MRQIRKIILLALGVCWTVSGWAQSATQADQLFNQGAYTEAGIVYAKLLRKSPTSALYNYRYARCLQETGHYREAVERFQKAGDRYVLRYFFEGECYLQLGRAEEAIACYNTYLEHKNDSERAPYIASQIARAEKQARYLKHVEQVVLLDSVDVAKKDLLSAYRDLSPDAGQLTVDAHGCVTYTNSHRDHRVMTRQDAKQQTKLYTQQQLLNTWEGYDTLPATVNHSKHQNYPYCLADGVTLYFASDSEEGLGGWDIYVSRYNTAQETYTTPENIGYPFNSSANDYMLVLDETRQTGYWATDRFCSDDSVRVYTFLIPEETSYWPKNDTNIVAYARLLISAPRKQPAAHAIATDKQVTCTETSFQLVINDTLVYTKESDFRHPETLELYRSYRDIVHQHAQTQQALERLRETYAYSDEEKRKQISPDILSLETRCNELQEAMQQMMEKIVTLQ